MEALEDLTLPWLSNHCNMYATCDRKLLNAIEAPVNAQILSALWLVCKCPGNGSGAKPDLNLSTAVRAIDNTSDTLRVDCVFS